MADRLPPHDLGAEEALLGAMLLSREAILAAAPLVVASDLYRPGHQPVYDAILGLDAEGCRVDPITVADRLRGDGRLESVGGIEFLHRLQNATPTVSNAERYAAVIVRCARLRALILAGSVIVEEALAGGADPDVVLERSAAGLHDHRVLPRGDGMPVGLWRMSEFLDSLNGNGDTPDGGRDWVVPGMLRAGWRAVVVGEEGGGKSLLLRQLAATVASGRHPFVADRVIPALPTLTVDAENPADVIDHQAQLIDSTAMASLSQSGNWWLWHVEAGLNLTQRGDQVRFERVLDAVHPKLVTIGPAYKLYPVKVGDDWSAPTMALLRFLQEQAVRFGFALVIEHHAPKGGAGVRALFPAGASEWLRWPEFGIRLIIDRTAGKDDQGRPRGYQVGRFRGDRLPAQWPTRLVRSAPRVSGALPWEGTYPDGTF